MMSAATLKWILFNSTQLDNWSAGWVWADAAQKSSSCYKSPCTQDSAVSSPSLHWHYHGAGEERVLLYYVGRECPRHHHHHHRARPCVSKLFMNQITIERAKPGHANIHITQFNITIRQCNYLQYLHQLSADPAELDNRKGLLKGRNNLFQRGFRIEIKL